MAKKVTKSLYSVDSLDSTKAKAIFSNRGTSSLLELQAAIDYFNQSIAKIESIISLLEEAKKRFTDSDIQSKYGDNLVISVGDNQYYYHHDIHEKISLDENGLSHSTSLSLTPYLKTVVDFKQVMRDYKLKTISSDLLPYVKSVTIEETKWVKRSSSKKGGE